MNDETIFEERNILESKSEASAKEVSNNENGSIVGTQSKPTGTDAKDLLSRTDNQEDKKSRRKNIGAVVAAGVGGIALGVLTPKFCFPNSEDDAVLVSEELEVGETESLEGHILPVAHNIDDSMSFNEAFGTARKEVGAGGVFTWHGNTYGTYYKSEWEGLSDEEEAQYWADVHHTTTSLNEEEQELNDDLNSINENNSKQIIEEGAGDDSIEANDVQLESEEDVIIQESNESVTIITDLDGDGMMDTVVTDLNGNDMPDIIIDTNADGNFDTVILDVDLRVSDDVVGVGDGIYVDESVQSSIECSEDGDPEMYVDNDVIGAEQVATDSDSNFDADFGLNDMVDNNSFSNGMDLGINDIV